MLLLAMFVIIMLAIIVWNWSYQIAQHLHVSHNLVDAFSVLILWTSFVSASALTQKEYDNEPENI